MSRRLVVLNGIAGENRPRGPWDSITAVDGGAEILRGWELPGQRIVGDFDSASPETVDWHVARGAVLERFPTDKDQTDFELALGSLVPDPASEVHLVGLAGGRADMSLANFLILGRWADRGWFTFDHPGGTGGVIDRGALRISAPIGTPAALIALCPKVEGILSQGVQWPLQNESLQLGEGRGVSNCLIAPAWRLRVGSGPLLWLLEGISRADLTIEREEGATRSDFRLGRITSE